jgi:hypothetical protein
MATPTEYRSTDASAPVLTGEVGKLNALLKAILVDGYGAKSAAGWTMPYNSGTDYAMFRQGAGLQHYLWCNDTNAQMSRLVGYVTASSHTAGTNPFPTETQFSAGLYARKSITASATARPWICWATDKHFALFILGGSTVLTTPGGGDSHVFFGQMYAPALSGDVFHSLLIAASDTSTTSTAGAITRQVLTPLGLTLAGHYMPQSYTQSGGAINVGKRANQIYAQSQSGGSGGSAYPEPCSGGLHLSRMSILETALPNRGYLPGIWSVGHSYSNFTHLDTLTGNSTLSGKSFTLVGNSAGAASCVAIETNGGW